jgi:hypothetical protein
MASPIIISGTYWDECRTSDVAATFLATFLALPSSTVSIC